MTPFTKYIVSRSVFDDTPIGILSDRDKLLSFGVSVGIPVFNRNQGAKAEAALAISQAQKRREFLEQVVRSEVASAYARYEASREASRVMRWSIRLSKPLLTWPIPASAVTGRSSYGRSSARDTHSDRRAE